MPIKSYLTYPEPGRLREVAEALGQIPGCEVFPSTTHEVLILVTDTEGDDDERRTEDAVQAVEGIQCLALVSGAEPELIQIAGAQEVVA